MSAVWRPQHVGHQEGWAAQVVQMSEANSSVHIRPFSEQINETHISLKSLAQLQMLYSDPAV